MRETTCGDSSGAATELCAFDGAPSLDILWGAAAIAAFAGCTRRQVYQLSEDPAWPFFKANGKICARRSTLAAFIARKEKRLCP
jgi:hypothetical protein